LYYAYINKKESKMSIQIYQWSVIGAGPAGIASVGLLLDAGVAPQEILWVDPEFKVGDFGAKWGEVSSNTSVKLFKEFLLNIKSFNYSSRDRQFNIDKLPDNGFCQLKNVAEPLQYITDHLRTKINTVSGFVTNLQVLSGCWNFTIAGAIYMAQKVILATGSDPRDLVANAKNISLCTALTPKKLSDAVKSTDRVAVFGSSHSAMIIIKNLLDAGVAQVVNFYLTPIKFAINMQNYILYDNSGLKGETAIWTHHNITQTLHPRVTRYIASEDNVEKALPLCDKVVYAIGFKSRAPHIADFNVHSYDVSNGIIAPGLFGAGIAFPKQVTDPNGNKELNVGLWKFMCDIQQMLPIWFKYNI
jgi:hypothetical protein